MQEQDQAFIAADQRTEDQRAGDQRTGDQPAEDETSLEEFSPQDLEPREFIAPSRRRMAIGAGVVLALVLLVVLPPLLNVNRYQRQIAASIGQSLGRPVHTGTVTLNLLPWPGFTIENFVVSEDPEFGSEPVIRANSVQARLRWRSLWRRRVEFSRITLAEPSVNLVRRQDGRWNLESILLQASRMPAAPTGQRGPGDRPRFPYIEATGARLNIKMDLEKMPVSLTESDFALWLPEPDQWHVRLEARPARTDAAATDTGLISVDGTLGRADNLGKVPVDLKASWTGAPLGAASWVVMDRDAGLRGDLMMTVDVKGTVADNLLGARLHVAQLRRADFVPAQTIDLDLTCSAEALELFRRLDKLQCAWPASGSGATLGASPAGGAGLRVTGAVPDVRAPGSADLRASVQGVPASALLDAVRVVSKRVSPELRLEGTLAGEAACCEVQQAALQEGGAGTELLPQNPHTAKIQVADARLTLGQVAPYFQGTLTGELVDDRLMFEPVTLDLGAVTPVTVAASLGWKGLDMHMSGLANRARLLQLADALPQFGDGLASALPQTLGTGPVRLDLLATRTWSGVETWVPALVVRPVVPRRHGRR